MPKKKQVTFQQQSIEGKFIPRISLPSTSVYPLGATDNRFNSKMVEFLTFSSSSSSSKIDENPIETTTTMTMTMSRSPFLRQRIVSMLDSVKKSDNTSITTATLKSQPITFGQLRKATISTEISIETKQPEEKRIDPVLPLPNENRPPPPSYASSIAQNLQHRNPFDDVSRLSSNLSSQSLSNLSLTLGDNSKRPPHPPTYRSPSPSFSSSTTFDHQFSRFLYGKDSNKYRRIKSNRKALSDPVKKAIDEANRSHEKSHRRFTTNLQAIDTDKEEQSDEVESSSGSHHKYDLIPSIRRRGPRSNNFFRQNLVPASPGLKRRIPTFLRVYSQASPSTDLLLQWDLFNIPELETLDMMMGRLYKNENLARVQFYESYRTFLLNFLASKRN